MGVGWRMPFFFRPRRMAVEYNRCFIRVPEPINLAFPYKMQVMKQAQGERERKRDFSNAHWFTGARIHT
jgi:hypothetical protein